MVDMQDQKEIGEKIITLSVNCGKDGPHRKTVQYKEKKLASLKELWDEFEKNDNDIKLHAVNDNEYDLYYHRVQSTYMELKKKLDAIVGSTKTSLTSNHSDSDDDDDEDKKIEIEMKRQEVRFKSLSKIFEEIDKKFTNDEQMSVTFCKTRLVKLKNLWDRIENSQEVIMTNEELIADAYLDSYNEMDELVDQHQLLLQETLEEHLSMGNRSNFHPDAVKLQRLQIPKFFGDYDKWITFKDLFTGMVHDNKAYTNAQKLQILKTVLGGDAEKLINHLTISDANYKDAWDLLLERYNDNKTMVYRSINKIMTQPAAKGDAKSLKQLLDTTQQTLLALKNMGRSADTWDDWVVVVITQKMNEETRKDWGKKMNQSKELPTWAQLKEFLEEEFKMMEELENSSKRNSHSNGNKGYIKSYQGAIAKRQCPACEGSHKLWKCDKFKTMEVQQRWEMAKNRRLCFKCLGNHNSASCEKEKSCKHCEKAHSTWGHEERGSSRKPQVNCATKAEESNEKPKEVCSNIAVLSQVDHEYGLDKIEVKNMVAAYATQSQEQVLLATAVIATIDCYGRKVMLRALIDSGSQGSMLTDTAAALLQHDVTQSPTNILSLGGNSAKSAKIMAVTIKPRFDSDYEYMIECYILQKLTRPLPDENLQIEKWKHIKGLKWADPKFHKVGRIDMLLGADVVASIMKSGLIKGNVGEPIAQETELGWIISGKIDPSYKQQTPQCFMMTTEDDMPDLSRFWEIEDFNPTRALTNEEQECETLYTSTVKHLKTGKFQVKIPFKKGFTPESLGSSRGQCIARFHQLEKKFARNPDLKKEYVTVINEYIEMGHLKLVTDKPLSMKKYYIPHHMVIKMESLTTKMRVVFDASAKTTNGVSLNDCMHVGAKQQRDLFETLVKWRMHRIVFKADITKMYRMIGLDEEDQEFHTIVWRDDPKKQLQEYQLTTVTFGTASAPFLAMRTLKQLALEYEEEYPVAAQMVKNDFYVDDLMSGVDTVEQAIHAKEQILNLMEKGGFQLRKWTSNNQELLNSIPDELKEKSLLVFKDDESTKALGLQWNPKTHSKS